MRRRRFLSVVGGGAAAVAGGKAVDNVLLGYGRVSGTNLVEQDLESEINERLGPVDDRTIEVTGTAVELRSGALRVVDEDLPWSTARRELERVERDHGLPGGALVELAADVPALRAHEHAVEPLGLEAFFQRAAASVTRPYAVAALRGPRVRDVSPTVVEAFTGVDPADPHAVADALVDAFREHTFYDAPRYAAGSIEENVLLGAADLRTPFDSPSDFRTMLDGENRGIFCYDFAYRSIEAFHAVSADEQTVPVVGAYVRDARHKHAYTGLATVVRDENGRERTGHPTLLVTFLDYTPTTAAHDFGVTPLAEDPDAYGTGHRTTDIYWNRRTRT